MPRPLSMPKLASALIFSFVIPAWCQLSATSIRQPGDSLDPSIRNEAEHAVDLAAAWLAAHQNSDGSWGSETGRVWRTSSTLLALTTRTAQHSDACARAAVWLDRHAPSAADPSDTHAWRVIALLSVTPDPAARASLAQRLFQSSQACVQPTNAPYFSRELWDDARALAGAPPAPPPENGIARLQLSELAANAQRLSAGAADCRWRDVRTINRLGQGALERDGTPLDWRRDVAQNLINALRRDPSGGGYWGKEEGDARILQTTFGVLTLQEL